MEYVFAKNVAPQLLHLDVRNTVTLQDLLSTITTIQNAINFQLTRLHRQRKLLIALPLIFVFYWICWVIYARTFHPLSKIPGPFLASISRLWVVWRVYQGDMEHIQRQLHQKYCPLLRIIPHELACAEREAIKKLYPTQSPLTKTIFYPPWGGNIFTKHSDHFRVTDEKVHTERRRIVNHVYSLSNVLQSEEYINQCSLLFIQRIGEHADSGRVLDPGEWLQWYPHVAHACNLLLTCYLRYARYAFNIVGELFFGKMSGFMVNRGDHKSWIAHMDTLLPVLCIEAVAPSYTRSLFRLSSVLNPVVRQTPRSCRPHCQCCENLPG